jgi:phosphoenolpyruvate carboxylase
MRFRTITALLTTTVLLTACSESATAPTASLEAELEEVVFDASASPNDVAVAADRRSGPRGPTTGDRRLTAEQRQCVQDAVEAFRAANKDILSALQEIHQKAREAKEAGATRAEIARILEEAKPLLERLRSAHEALHEKIRACLAR